MEPTHVHRSFPREKETVEKQKLTTNPVQSCAKSNKQPTTTSASAKSQKSLRRGQIFRKQTRKNSQVNDESSLASKENTNGVAIDVLTHMTTPTDA